LLYIFIKPATLYSAAGFVIKSDLDKTHNYVKKCFFSWSVKLPFIHLTYDFTISNSNEFLVVAVNSLVTGA